MPRKPKQYPLGSSRTIGKRKSFIHYRTTITSNGPTRSLHQTIESFMIDNPGKPLPTKSWIKKFGTSKTKIHRVAKKVEQAHSTKPRSFGRPAPLMPKEAEEIIKMHYKKARKGGTIKLTDIIIEIAKQTGIAIPHPTIAYRVLALEKKLKKGLRINYLGTNKTRTIAETVKFLKSKKIEVKKAGLYKKLGLDRPIK
ncbi:MAG: hypothetical protein CL944_00170 [Candidatus Diapherotrites archaeon]|uniref:Uncharacterized protein n=1 Tax=Candidatus Iainarchaeum sp. TaxID=3101447 RepID=A0A2D6LNW3_9ARCH|nr:hypothetical protein [Candidatus Diapherotrites archaeon]|tara:strand:- start:3399 stop:3989 length:591 start_codon:yes stop_codon:yes gene_type:complete